TEGVSVQASVNSRYGRPAFAKHDNKYGRMESRDAAFKSLPDLLLRQVAADKNDATHTLFALSPGALVVAIQDHVHALKDEALVIILEGEDALAAHNARPLLLHQILHPREKLVGIERLVGRKRHRMHFFVVVVLEAAV